MTSPSGLGSTSIGFISAPGQAVDGHGGSAPEPGSERVELTMTDTAGRNLDDSRIQYAVDLTEVELRMLIGLYQQELERLESGPLGRDFPQEDLAV